MDLHQYIIFVSIAFFYIISPGPAVFLAINYGAVHGMKKTAVLLLGNSSGLAILAIVSALGLGALIVQSFIMLTIVKILGALVLLYLGSKMLYSIIKNRMSAKKTKSNNTNSKINTDSNISEHVKFDIEADKTVTIKDKPQNDDYLSFYKKGLFLSLTNPKAIIFFTAIFPQFMIAGQSIQSNLMTMLFLGATFACLSFLCMNIYNILGQKVLARFLNNTGITVLNLISGVVFIAMSGVLAFADLSQKD